MPSLLTKSHLSLISATLLATGCLSAHAAGPEDLARYGFDLGVGAGVRPAYEGSDDEKLRAIPLVRAFYNTSAGRFSLGANGLTWSVPLNRFEVGAALGYDRGRKESASPDLAGLGDINRSATLGAFGAYRPGPWEFRVATRSSLSSSNSSMTTIDTGAAYHLRLSERWILSPGIEATWANDRYMNRYFSVNDEQSHNSGLREYDADAGWKSASINLNVMYRLSKNWGVMADLRNSVILGDAADSPITRKKNQASAMLGISYHWQAQ